MQSEINGLYNVAFNILAAVLTDMLEKPDGEQRVTKLLTRLDTLNEQTIPDPIAREKASLHLAATLAAFRTTQP